jgi:tripartite-type tricarboxylate transporter receptor subunit TctC
MAPAGTPPPIVDKLARAVNEALTSDEVLASLKLQGFDKLGGTPEEFAHTIAADIERWTVAAQAAGLKK